MRQETPLPRILCLHGSGSNAAVFRSQTRYIRLALHDYFEFIFVDAPFESKAGPGVLPMYEGCGPYFRWTSREEGEHEGRYLPKSWPMRLRFAVCAMAEESQPLQLTEAYHDETIHIPTIHVHGVRDPIYAQNKLLTVRRFDPRSTRVLTIDAGHHLPKGMDETSKLAEVMLKTCYPRDCDAGCMELHVSTTDSY